MSRSSHHQLGKMVVWHADYNPVMNFTCEKISSLGSYSSNPVMNAQPPQLLVVLRSPRWVGFVFNIYWCFQPMPLACSCWSVSTVSGCLQPCLSCPAGRRLHLFTKCAALLLPQSRPQSASVVLRWFPAPNRCAWGAFPRKRFGGTARAGI